MHEHDTDHTFLYLSPHGDDAWSGRLPESDAAGSDGPLATLSRARDMLRAWKEEGKLSGPVTVLLREGRYVLSEPLRLGPEDAGPITYAAYPGERPILDGGQRIQGWRVEERDEGPVWVTDLPEVAAGNWYFRQLFVNGERRSRTRLPKEGFYWIQDLPGLELTGSLVDNFFQGTDTFRAAPGDIRAWHNLTDVEVVAIHYWIGERMPIASFEPETNVVTSARRSTFFLRDDVAFRYAKYYVENVCEALEEPGEWYLDRTTGRLTYIPMPGEDPATAGVYAPRLEQLLQLEGDADERQYVAFLRFQGLTFEHTGCRQPPGGGEPLGQPELDLAASTQAAYRIPGVIRLEGARNCVIEACTIRHVGWYGIELADGCLGNRIVGNELFDLGGGGVQLNGADARGPVERRTGNNVVTDNHIHAGGWVFFGAVGILSRHSFGNDLSHNHIHDLFYSGISCGWSWGYGENVSKNNRIEKNHIHDLGHGLLSDMGGIYTLGVQPGTVLRGNVIHDIEKCNYGGWCIYLDEGSSHILVESNLCYNASSQAFNQHYGRENIVRNNVLAFGRQAVVSLGRAEEHNSFTLERNILIARGQPMFSRSPRGVQDRPGFKSDLNLFWDLEGEVRAAVVGEYDQEARWQVRRAFTREEWRERGNDRHSLIADPQCKDLLGHDFALRKDAPAFGLGFEELDTADVGPRPRGRRLWAPNFA